MNSLALDIFITRGQFALSILVFLLCAFMMGNAKAITVYAPESGLTMAKSTATAEVQKVHGRHGRHGHHRHQRHYRHNYGQCYRYYGRHGYRYHCPKHHRHHRHHRGPSFNLWIN